MELKKCKECKYIGYRFDEEAYAYCSKMNRKVNRFQCPEWCPLKEKKEQK